MLILERVHRDDKGTRGILHADGVTIAATLEPACCDGLRYQGLKPGRYPLCFTYSPKFRRRLPLLVAEVREGIRIHAGNSAADTSGCVLVGDYFFASRLCNSRVALDRVIKEIERKGYKELLIYENISC